MMQVDSLSTLNGNPFYHFNNLHSLQSYGKMVKLNNLTKNELRQSEK